jgi:hypothetical protein
MDPFSNSIVKPVILKKADDDLNRSKQIEG